MFFELQPLIEGIFILSDYTDNAERGRYVPSLVTLSYIIASLGAFVALRLINDIFLYENKRNQTYLHIAGAFTLAVAIWSMHFVGMLAYDMEMVHSFEPTLTFVSMLIAFFVAYLFITIVRVFKPNLITYVLGAIVLGGAISSMHYTGMLAMEMEAHLFYDPKLFGLSLVIAGAASFAAMWLIYKIKKYVGIARLKWQIAAALAIGLATCGMHYMGMAAAVFIPFADCRFDAEQTYYSDALLIVMVCGIVFIGGISINLKQTQKRHFNDFGKSELWKMIPAFILLFGITITTIASQGIRNFNAEQDKMLFNAIVDDAESGLLKHYNLYSQALKSGAGLIDASVSISNEQWNDFFAAQQLDTRLISFLNIGYIEHLKDENVTNTSNYDIKYSYSKNKDTDFFKVGTSINADIIKALEKSTDAERKTTVSSNINLNIDGEQKSGFVLILPLLRNDDSVKGWIYAPFLAQDIFKYLLRGHENEVAYAIYDNEEPINKYSSPNYNDDYVTKLKRTNSSSNTKYIFNTDWHAIDGFKSGADDKLMLITVFLGLFFSAFIARMTHSQNKRAKKILESKLEAERAHRAKDGFFANMSHELRTPLNSIIGLVNILLTEKGLNQDQKGMLEIVDKSSHSLLIMLNDVLDLSKIESANVTLELIPCRLSDIVDEAIEQMKPLASQKSLEFKYSINDSSESHVLADGFRLSRILLNLLSNAIKYTPTGFVSIDSVVTTSDKDVTLQVKVSDSGIGIALDKLEYVFDKFSQAEESTERRFGGTGLGLNITQKLVELMGGTIAVESELHKGSTFTVNLCFKACELEPLPETSNQVEKVERSSHRTSIKDATILVAEDHEFNQLFISRLLKHIGLNNFTLVANGQEAFEERKKGDYTLILMDCHMPTLDGYKATQLIREYEESSSTLTSIPIVAMTADATEGAREQCISAGMDQYISKPLNKEEFKNILERWLILE